MATSTEEGDSKLYVREQVARIDKMQAEITKIQQDTRYAPWTIGITLLGAGAALFAAGAAFTKLLLG